MHLKVLDLPIISYKETLDLQHRIVQYKINNPGLYDFLITLEHKPVYTIGKNANFSNLKVSENILKTKNIELIKSDRGGDITYHCPEQLTLYTIINLKNIKKSLKYNRIKIYLFVDFIFYYDIFWLDLYKIIIKLF